MWNAMCVICIHVNWYHRTGKIDANAINQVNLFVVPWLSRVKASAATTGVKEQRSLGFVLMAHAI